MTQLSDIQNTTNDAPAMKPGQDDKVAELTRMLKEHIANQPQEDSSRRRDAEIAKMQNEAAVAERNIRKFTMEIEEQQRERAALKDDRQQKYEAMNSANNVLQGKKQEKDVVFQRLRSHRAGANALRVNQGRDSFKSIKQLDDAIRSTERRMQTEVLSLREEKDMIRRLREYRKMRPEVAKVEAQYKQLDSYKESTEEQTQADEAEYTRLKAAVEKAYQFQQTQYELFREAKEIDQEISDKIDAAIQKRREMYDKQRETRDAVIARRRNFQKSVRQVQQWEMKTRRLKEDIQRAKREQERRARNERVAREREERRAREDYDERSRLEEKEAEEARAAEPARPAAETPGRTTQKPRARARATPRRVYEAPPRDAFERQKEQLAVIETYVDSLTGRAGGAAAAAQAAPARSTGARKGVFKPSRDEELFADDLFKGNTKKGKKNKRKRNKKVKEVLLVQTPPNVTISAQELGRWLSNKGCPQEIVLPMRASEAADCLATIKLVREWVDQYEESPAPTAEPQAEAAAEAEEASEEPAQEAEAEAEAAAEPEPEPMDEASDAPTDEEEPTAADEEVEADSDGEQQVNEDSDDADVAGEEDEGDDSPADDQEPTVAADPAEDALDAQTAAAADQMLADVESDDESAGELPSRGGDESELLHTEAERRASDY